MKTIACLPSFSIKINLNLKSSFPFTFSKNGLSFVIQKDLQLPNCLIEVEIAKGNVKDIKAVCSHISNPIVRKDMNNFVIQNIGKEQNYVKFVLCFEFAYKKWNYYVTDLSVVVPFHALSHLAFGEYYYDEFTIFLPDTKNGDMNLVFKAYWVRSIDSKRAPVFKLYVEKKNGIIIKGADKDNMVLTIPDKQSSRKKHATKNLNVFFNFDVFPQLSPSFYSSTDCTGCQYSSVYGMNCSPWYFNHYYPSTISEMPFGYPNIENCNRMHPYVFHTCTSTQNEASGSQKSESESSQRTQPNPTKTNELLNLLFNENKPPEFEDVHGCFKQSRKFVPSPPSILENSLLSTSGQTCEDRIFIDKNRQMLNSLPKYSKFSAPIGGRPSICGQQNASSVEHFDKLSLSTSKTSIEAVPSSKPENLNELDLTNPTLAKLFAFHDGKLTPISPPATPKNVLKKLFPSNLSVNSKLQNSASEKSFEIADDPSMIDIESQCSDFSESFKSTSSKP